MTSYVSMGMIEKLETITFLEISNHMDVTLKGSFKLNQIPTPYMKENKYGRIINVGKISFIKPCCPLSCITLHQIF